jgi:hypothetical protein
MLRDLRLDVSEPPGVAGLDEAGWEQIFRFADPQGLTLLLRERAGHSALPEEMRRRLDRNAADNTERGRRLRASFGDMAAQLARAGIEFGVLKGFTHAPDFIADTRHRVQHDLDLFFTPEGARHARDLLLKLGFEPVSGFDDLPLSHLPVMIRKSDWTWRGNYFDPEAPLAVELHYRLWHPETERLEAPGVEEFWGRRVTETIGGQEVSCLELADRLGYAALHALRHLLRGSLKVLHVYEIACFLARRQGDAAFWDRWSGRHPPELRRLEAIVFRLAEAWFGAPRARAAEPLPESVEAWVRKYGWSPVESVFRPNKDELYLHLALLESSRDRWNVVRRRLLPARLPRARHGAFVAEEQKTLVRRAGFWLQDAGFLAARLARHARVLPAAVWGLLRRTRGRAE